eukprot:3142948-Pleurochrysis_carterae.AAC.2
MGDASGRAGTHSADAGRGAELSARRGERDASEGIGSNLGGGGRRGEDFDRGEQDRGRRQHVRLGADNATRPASVGAHAGALAVANAGALAVAHAGALAVANAGALAVVHAGALAVANAGALAVAHAGALA